MQSLDKIIGDSIFGTRALGILIGKEVRAMQEEWKEKEVRLFQSLKQALEKNKTLARNCLA
jgi:hypothetical protein